jgi:thioredoxin-related protein
MGYTFPVYFDKDSDAAYKYGIQSIPTTFFIDANGNLIAYGQGAMDGDTLKRGISMIYAEEK